MCVDDDTCCPLVVYITLCLFIINTCWLKKLVVDKLSSVKDAMWEVIESLLFATPRRHFSPFLIFHLGNCVTYFLFEGQHFHYLNYSVQFGSVAVQDAMLVNGTAYM